MVEGAGAEFDGVRSAKLWTLHFPSRIFLGFFWAKQDA